MLALNFLCIQESLSTFLIIIPSAKNVISLWSSCNYSGYFQQKNPVSVS